VYASRPPSPDEIAILNRELLACTIRVGEALRGMTELWAIGGDAGLVLHGVPVEPDGIEIITTSKGVDEALAALRGPVAAAPEVRERRLPRDALVDGAWYPLFVRSRYAAVPVEGVTVELHGDRQLRIGEWEWGDPLRFKPEVTQVTTADVNLVPLRLESEFAFALGWDDLARKIADAIARQTHQGMKTQGISAE